MARLAKTSARLLLIWTAVVGLVPAMWAQAQGQAQAQAQGQAQGQPAQKPTPKEKAPAAAKAKPGKSAKPRKKAAAKKASKRAAPPAPAKRAEPIFARRDPFMPLINVRQAGPMHLPPGKAGLIVGQVRVDGTVQAPSGMIAVVSNPEQRVYFIREGDRLYDGLVEKISLDGVTFRENSKDAFGRMVERLVVKRVYPSAGEQQ